MQSLRRRQPLRMLSRRKARALREGMTPAERANLKKAQAYSQSVIRQAMRQVAQTDWKALK